MISNRLALASVPLCVLATTVAAQSPPPPSLQCIGYNPTNTIDWPDAYGSGSDFRRVVGGNFEGSDDVDGYDLVALMDSQLFYIPRISYQTAILPVPWEPVEEGIITDIAVFPDGIASGKDGLLVCDADGLHLVDIAGGTVVSSIYLAAGSWSGANRLQVADVDGDGNSEVLGSDGGTMLVLHGPLSASPTTTSFSAASAILDFEVFNWTSVLAGQELGVVTASGLVVYSGAGTALRTFAHTSSHGQLARVRVGGTSDLLAWSRLASGTGTPELVTVRLTTVSSGQSTEFDLCSDSFVVDPVTLTGGDYDGDGFDDLLLTYEANETMTVMLNLGTSPWYSTVDTEAFDVIPLTATPNVGTGNVATPFFGNLDGYGTADIVHAVSRTETIEVWMNAAYIHHLDDDPITADQIVLDDCEIHPDMVIDSTNEGELQFPFDVPTDWDQTHLEVIVFDQADPSPNNAVNPSALHHYVFTLVASANQYVLFGDLAQNDYWTDHRHYYMRYRFVNASGTNPIVFTNASPWFVGGWTLRSQSGTNPTPAALAGYYMMSNGGFGTALGLYEEEDPGGQSTAVGAYVPMTRVPPFPPGSNPTIPAAGYAGTAQGY